MLNQIMLQGTVTNLKLVHYEEHSSCKHQYFDLNFEGGLCNDSINVCDWTNASVKDGDDVLVTGCLLSNEESIKDGYELQKEWFIMVNDTQNHSVIKLQEDSND